MDDLLTPDAALTHAALVDRAVRWLRTTRGCSVAYAELTTAALLIPDAIGWGWVCEMVECKVSRTDFRRDREKPAHKANALPGTRRWYMTPPGLLTAADLPEGWGLAEAHARCVRVIVKPRDLPVTTSGYRAEVAILKSVARRHELGVPFDPVRGRFATVAEQEARRG